MTTVPRAEHSTLSTMISAVAAVSLVGVLVGVAVSYQPPVERKPAEAPRPRITHIAAFALA